MIKCRAKFFILVVLLSSLILIGIQFHNKLPSRLYSKLMYKLLENQIHKDLQPYNYGAQGEYYRERLAYIQENSKNGYELILLGNSIIEGGKWDTLFDEGISVLNFGIGGDITLGMLNRLNFVITKSPRFCILEGGINDLNNGIPLDSVELNYNDILTTLKSNNIIPIVTSVTYVSRNFKNAISFNTKIKELNNKILALTKLHHFDYIDLNIQLCKDGFLETPYTFDGLHYTETAYKIYENEILIVLDHYNQD